jgi:hypothetical protein
MNVLTPEALEPYTQPATRPSFSYRDFAKNITLQHVKMKELSFTLLEISLGCDA